MMDEVRHFNEPPHLVIAERELGIAEIPGPKANTRISEYLTGVGANPSDETPWCAAFANWCLAKAGIRGTGKPNARSFLVIGDPVNLADARPGDIVVFWRGDPKGWTGHVAFFWALHDADTIEVLGGNQSNAVSIATYPIRRILGIRRVTSPASEGLEG